MEFFDEERRARLLQFVTGSSRVPLQGFKALQGRREGGTDDLASRRRGQGVSTWCMQMVYTCAYKQILFSLWFLSVTLVS